MLKNLFRPGITCWRRLVIDGFYGGIWQYKEHLREHPLKIGLVLYNSYLTDYGSWNGVEAEIKSSPMCPHGIHGLFISKAASIGYNCVIFQQVMIGSVTTIGSKHIGAP